MNIFSHHDQHSGGDSHAVDVYQEKGTVDRGARGELTDH